MELQKSQENILRVFVHYFGEKNVKEFKPLFAAKVLINDIFVQSLQSHENIDNLLVAIQPHQIQVEQSFKPTGPVLVETNHKLLKTHFSLLQGDHLRHINSLVFILSVLVESHP